MARLPGAAAGRPAPRPLTTSGAGATTSWTRWSASASRARRSWRRFRTPRRGSLRAAGAAWRCGWRAGGEEPLRPRSVHESLVEEIELARGRLGASSSSGRWSCWSTACSRTRPAAGGACRRLRLEARLAGGGGWRIEAPLRQASADRERLLLALQPKLGGLPAPALTLALRALETGPARAATSTTLDAADARGARAGGLPRRCARCGRPPARTRCCGCSRSTQTRGCPSGARC